MGDIYQGASLVNVWLGEPKHREPFAGNLSTSPVHFTGGGVGIERLG